MIRRISSIIGPEDVLGLAGLVAIFVGAWLVDPRLGFFVVGGALLLMAVAIARASRVSGDT